MKNIAYIHIRVVHLTEEDLNERQFQYFNLKNPFILSYQ